MLVVLLLFSLLSAGCGKDKKEQSDGGQESTKSQQSEKAPDQLKDLEASIEKIIQELKGPSAGEDEEQQPKEGQQAEEGKQDQQQNGQAQQKDEQQQEQTKKEEGQQKEQTQQDSGSKNDQQKEGEQQEVGQQKQGGKQQGGQQQGSKQQAAGQDKTQPQDQWQQVSDTVSTMHYQWNDYMPDAVKNGASTTLLDNFSNSLNILTNTVATRDRMNTLMAASNLYGLIPDFYSLYKTGSSHEIKRIRHYMRDAMLNSTTGNWEQALSSISKLKSSWSLYKNAISKENQDNATKLDFSIHELDKVVTSKNQGLVEIKGRVGLSNLKALEKAIENESDQEGQESTE